MNQALIQMIHQQRCPADCSVDLQLDLTVQPSAQVQTKLCVLPSSLNIKQNPLSFSQRPSKLLLNTFSALLMKPRGESNYWEPLIRNSACLR